MSSLDARISEVNEARVRAEDRRLSRRVAILVIAGASFVLWSTVAAVAARLVG